MFVSTHIVANTQPPPPDTGIRMSPSQPAPGHSPRWRSALHYDVMRVDPRRGGIGHTRPDRVQEASVLDLRVGLVFCLWVAPTGILRRAENPLLHRGIISDVAAGEAEWRAT